MPRSRARISPSPAIRAELTRDHLQPHLQRVVEHPWSDDAITHVHVDTNLGPVASKHGARRAITHSRAHTYPLPAQRSPATTSALTTDKRPVTRRRGATNPRSVPLQPIATVSITDGVGAHHPHPVFSQPTRGGEPTRRRSPANPLQGAHTLVARAHTPTAYPPPTRVAPTFMGARGRRSGGGLLCRATSPGASPHPCVARHVVRHSMGPGDSRARGCCGDVPGRSAPALTSTRHSLDALADPSRVALGDSAG